MLVDYLQRTADKISCVDYKLKLIDMEEIIKALKEIKEHQMNTVQLARSTEVYKLADKALKAITVIQCSKLLPDELQPVLAKIEHTNSLGTSKYWEVVYYDNKNWHSYQGSKTFEDGEKVVKWKYCKAIV